MIDKIRGLALDFYKEYHYKKSFKFPHQIEFLNKHIYIMNYEAGEKAIKQMESERLCSEKNAFCVDMMNDTYAIYFKSKLDKHEEIQVIAHEIGHVLLNHLLTVNLSGQAIFDDLSQEDKDKYEEEANKFADIYMERYSYWEKVLSEKKLTEDQHRKARNDMTALCITLILLAITISLIVELPKTPR